MAQDVAQVSPRLHQMCENWEASHDLFVRAIVQGMQHILSLPYTSASPYVSSSHIISHYKFSNISTPYQNSECWSYNVMLKAGCRRCGGQELWDRQERTM